MVSGGNSRNRKLFIENLYFLSTVVPFLKHKYFEVQPLFGETALLEKKRAFCTK